MKGSRKPDGTDPVTMVAGEYTKLSSGNWYLVTPNGLFGTISPTIHKIVEHPDGSITVTPSILVKFRDDTEWHGYLTKGEWRTV